MSTPPLRPKGLVPASSAVPAPKPNAAPAPVSTTKTDAQAAQLNKSAASTNVVPIKKEKIPASGKHENKVAHFIDNLIKQILSLFHSKKPEAPGINKSIHEAVNKVEQTLQGAKLNAIDKPIADKLQKADFESYTSTGADIWRTLGTSPIKINGKNVEGSDKSEKLNNLFTFLADRTLTGKNRNDFTDDCRKMITKLKNQATQGSHQNVLQEFVEKINEKGKVDPEYRNLARLLSIFNQISMLKPVMPVKTLLSEDSIQNHISSEAAINNPNRLILGGGVGASDINFREDNGAITVDNVTTKLLARISQQLNTDGIADQTPESSFQSKLSFTIPLNNTDPCTTSLTYVVATPEGGNTRTTSLMQSFLEEIGVEVTNKDRRQPNA